MSRFVFVPEDGRPHRLFRWTTLPGDQLAIYDEAKNLVLIDKEKFDGLTAYHKSRVLRTQRDLFWSDYLEADAA